MKQLDAEKELFEISEIDGKIVAFTNMRIERKTIPEGLYCYDIRDSDLCDGTCAEIKNGHVMVNHWGTIVCKEPFEFDKDGCYFPKDDMHYTGFYLSTKGILEADEDYMRKMIETSQSNTVKTQQTMS